MPTNETSLRSLSWLLVSAALLLSGLLLPIINFEGASWLSGQSLVQFSPALLTKESPGGQVFFILLATTAGLVAVLLLLGAARLLNSAIAIVIGIVATVAFLTSLFLVRVIIVGVNMSDGATVGPGTWALPLGFLSTMLVCYGPALRNGWVRPPKRRS